MTGAAVKGATVRRVRRSSVTPRILDTALDRPKRAEKPAANTTMRSPEAAFVGIMEP